MSDSGNTIIRREVRMLVREMDDKTILSVDLIDNGDGVFMCSQFSSDDLRQIANKLDEINNEELTA